MVTALAVGASEEVEVAEVTGGVCVAGSEEVEVCLWEDVRLVGEWLECDFVGLLE